MPERTTLESEKRKRYAKTEEALLEDEISLFSIGNTLLQNRWRVLRWAGGGAALAVVLVIFSPTLFQASASFVPQGSDASRSALAGLAGQLGVALPASNQALSPDFYVSLLRSRELLSKVARDTFQVREMGNRRVALLDLLKVDPGPASRREELGMKRLSELATPSSDKKTGTVQVDVKTPWPSVSLNIVMALIAGVNDYNERTRQTQAGAERKFLEGRLAMASADLRAAEDRLEEFLRTNRQFGSAAQLTFENERLKRNLTLRQEVYTSLTLAYEDARIREVRDVPVIAIVESPAVRTQPESRGWLKHFIVGFIAGGFVGALLAFVNGVAADIRKEKNPDGELFLATLGEAKRELFRPFWRRRQRNGT